MVVTKSLIDQLAINKRYRFLLIYSIRRRCDRGGRNIAGFDRRSIFPSFKQPHVTMLLVHEFLQYLRIITEVLLRRIVIATLVDAVTDTYFIGECDFSKRINVSGSTTL